MENISFYCALLPFIQCRRGRVPAEWNRNDPLMGFLWCYRRLCCMQRLLRRGGRPLQNGLRANLLEMSRQRRLVRILLTLPRSLLSSR